MALPAAIVDYDTLIQAVREYLINEDATDTDIAYFISQAEDDFEEDIKIEFTNSATGTFTEGVAEVAKPSDFLQRITFYYEIASDQVVSIDQYYDPVSFYNRQASVQQSVPAYHTRIGDEFIIGPIPDSDYSYVLRYNAQPQPLSSSNQTNAILDRSTNVYLYGTLFKAYEFFQDDNQTQKYEAKYRQSVDAMHRRDARERYAPGVRESTQNLDDSTWKLV